MHEVFATTNNKYSLLDNTAPLPSQCAKATDVEIKSWINSRKRLVTSLPLYVEPMWLFQWVLWMPNLFLRVSWLPWKIFERRFDLFVPYFTEIHCPDPINRTSTRVSFLQPEANFAVTSSYYYSRNGIMFAKYSFVQQVPCDSYYYWLGYCRSQYHDFNIFNLGETTNVTLSVAGASGLGATCSFTVHLAGVKGM